jgi:hypothetical protein
MGSPRNDEGNCWISFEPVESSIAVLEALPYRNVDIAKFYPYGDVSFP